MNVFDILWLIAHYIIWIPIKYTGIGIWWLVTYPIRRHKEKLLAEQREAQRRKKEAERKACAEREEAERKAKAEQEAARRKARAEREEAERKVRAEREEALRKAKAEQEEAERKALLTKEAQQKADLESYLKELNGFDQLPAERQKQLFKMQNLEFDLIKDAMEQIFAAIRDWILSDPENDPKMKVIKAWCDRTTSIEYRFRNYCNNVAKSKEETSANTNLDLQFCRTALQMGFFTHKSIPSYVSIIGNYYLHAGIAPIDCNDLIVNRSCFFKSSIATVAQRQSSGELYYDMDNATELTFYLFSDQFETLGNGHNSFPLSEIVDIHIDQKIKIADNHLMLLITFRNRPSLNFWCNAYTAIFLLALLPLMVTNRLHFQ